MVYNPPLSFRVLGSTSTNTSLVYLDQYLFGVYLDQYFFWVYLDQYLFGSTSTNILKGPDAAPALQNLPPLLHPPTKPPETLFVTQR